jgi:hypothetical protein
MQNMASVNFPKKEMLHCEAEFKKKKQKKRNCSNSFYMWNK